MSDVKRSPEASEATAYLWITGIVAVGLAAGFLAERLGAPAAWAWGGYALAYIAGGWKIVGASIAELRHRRLSIDFLMGAAAAGAAIVGRPLEGAVLIFLFSLSNALERFAMGRTRNAITRLLDLRPQEATLADEAGLEVGRVAVELLEPGQAILVRPGERIAADGVVRSGESEVDQAAITGESLPVARGPGDPVFAATINQGGALVVTVTRRAGDTMLAKIVHLVEEARSQRAPAQHFVDRFAHPYTLAVVIGTTLFAIVPPLLFDIPWATAFYRAMTLLVVASPCALVISTPSAILSGIANGARHGILFKGGAYLDLAGTIDAVAFDKTGTLTEGRPRLLEIIALQDEPVWQPAAWSAPDLTPEDALLRIAAAVEQSSEHHLARAAVEAARSRGLDLPEVSGFGSFPGEGVHGQVAGERVWAGNARMAARAGARLQPELLGWIAAQASLGRSVVYVGSGIEVHGALAFGDALRRNAAATVHHLKYEGIRWVSLLTGDHPEAARAIAAELGVDEVRAGLLPHEKVDAVREIVAGSRGVAMVGDGVNDAPAMAAATLGIAMGAAGTDVAIETADVVLMSDEIEKVDYVVHLGRRARAVVRQNVWFSIGWMLLLVVITLTIGMPLPIAVVAHEGSTLLVIANGLRLLRGRPHPPVYPAGFGRSAVPPQVRSQPVAS